MTTLKTDYKNDVLDTSENTERIYDLVDANGNVIQANVRIREKTVLSQIGDSFGASDVNQQNTEINQINQNLSEVFFAPDYANKVNLGGSATITEDGFIQPEGYTTTTGAVSTLTINGKTFRCGQNENGFTAWYSGGWVPFFPVLKGDVVSLTIPSGTPTLFFYPIRRA